MRARVSHLKNPPKNPQLQFSFDKRLCRKQLGMTKFEPDVYFTRSTGNGVKCNTTVKLLALF